MITTSGANAANSVLDGPASRADRSNIHFVGFEGKPESIEEEETLTDQ